MKIALLGRTRWLLDAGRLLVEGGHKIVVVATAKAEPFYNCGPDDFAALARVAGAQDLGVVSLRDPSAIKALKDAGADIAVSINWPTIVGKDVIDLFPSGVVNAHCGDLPRYRGNACPNWAILNGEKRIGLCTHYMAPGEVDAGPVLKRDYLPLATDTYITEVYDWLDRRVPTLLHETVAGLVADEIHATSQPDNPSLALRCYPRRPEDGQIDWRQPSELIHRLVRASGRPFAGAFSTLDSQRVTIWRARPYEHVQPFCAVPGQVMLRDQGRPVIACGTGALCLEEVEVAQVTGPAALTLVGQSVRARLS